MRGGQQARSTNATKIKEYLTQLLYWPNFPKLLNMLAMFTLVNIVEQKGNTKQI